MKYLQFVLFSLFFFSCSDLKETKKNIINDTCLNTFDCSVETFKHNEGMGSENIKKDSQESLKHNDLNITCENLGTYSPMGNFQNKKKTEIATLKSHTEFKAFFQDLNKNFGQCTKSLFQILLFTDFVASMVKKSESDNINWKSPLSKSDLLSTWKTTLIYSYWWSVNSSPQLLDYFLQNVQKITGNNYWSSYINNSILKEKVITILKSDYEYYNRAMFDYITDPKDIALKPFKARCDQYQELLKAKTKTNSEEKIVGLILVHLEKMCPITNSPLKKMIHELHYEYIPRLKLNTNF